MYTISRFITKNKNAGNDLYHASFILICIIIDPNSNMLSPKAPIKVKVLNWIEANNMIAKLTFKNPINKTQKKAIIKILKRQLISK